jgi:hypothetical protein
VSNWSQVFGFYSPELCQVNLTLIAAGEFRLPEFSAGFKIPLTTLGQLGKLGFDRKNIHQLSEDGRGPTEIACFWGRDNKKITSIAVKPTGFRKPKPGVSVKSFRSIQETSSNLLVPETIWLETTAFFFLYCPEKVISNVFWSFSPEESMKTVDGLAISNEEICKVLALWGNSSIGILLLLGMRQETRGGWIHWKKNTLRNLCVLDLTKMMRTQIDSLLTVCEEYLLGPVDLSMNFIDMIVREEKKELDSRLLKIIANDKGDFLLESFFPHFLRIFYEYLSSLRP